jgi:hypothetical protein
VRLERHTDTSLFLLENLRTHDIVRGDEIAAMTTFSARHRAVVQVSS